MDFLPQMNMWSFPIVIPGEMVLLYQRGQRSGVGHFKTKNDWNLKFWLLQRKDSAFSIIFILLSEYFHAVENWTSPYKHEYTEKSVHIEIGICSHSQASLLPDRDLYPQARARADNRLRFPSLCPDPPSPRSCWGCPLPTLE